MQEGKCQRRQINQSVLILNAPNTKAVRTVVAAHVGATAVKEQAAGVAANHRNGPVEAVAACVVDGTIEVVAVPCHNKL